MEEWMVNEFASCPLVTERSPLVTALVTEGTLHNGVQGH